jgi:WD40 repeat protein
VEARRLARLRRRLTARLPLLGGWLRRRALDALARDGSAESVRALVAAVTEGPADVRTRALEALGRLAAGGSEEAAEGVCRLVLDHDHPTARALAVCGGHLPRDPAGQALILFLTGQWDRYHALDFDGRLLEGAYRAAGPALRARLLGELRRSGHPQPVTVLAGRQRGRLGEMTDAEWRAGLDLLSSAGRWDELWRLARAAPPRWSAPLLRRLAEAGWHPPGPDRAGFDELVRLMLGWAEPHAGMLVRHRATLRGHTGTVFSLAFSADGHLLASGGQDDRVRLWDIPPHRQRWEREARQGWQRRLAFTSDGEVLICTGPPADRPLVTWRLLHRGQRVRTFGLDAPADRPLVMWRLPDGEPLPTGPVQVDDRGLALSPDGRLLAGGCWWPPVGEAIRLWGVPDGRVVRTLASPAVVRRLAFSPDARTLASADALGAVCLWALPEGRLLRCLRMGERGLPHGPAGVGCLAFSPDGGWLAACDWHGQVGVWSVADGDLVAVLSGHDERALDLAFTPDGTRLVTLGHDGKVLLWSVPEGRLILPLTRSAAPTANLAVSPDGRVLASGEALGAVDLWALPDGEHLGTLPGHAREVYCLAFSPDGGQLAGGGADHEVRLWGSELLRLARLPAGETTVADWTWAKDALRDRKLPAAERGALAFVEALMRQRRRFDVHLDDPHPRADAGRFDIQLG